MRNVKAIIGIAATIIIYVIASWLLIHVLALFGVFLAIAYPVWWLFVPKRTVCLLCKAQKDGEKCVFCKRRNTLLSAAVNGSLIFLLSLISIGIVYAESRLLFQLGFPPTPKTAKFVIPSKGQFQLGEIFPVKIALTNLKRPVNAVQADLGFNPDRVEVVSVSTTDSFANIFVQKEINNTGGWFRLTGGLPNPGYTESQGTFGTVFFRAKLPGLARIQFLSSSMVLANDGHGTNILKDYPQASYLILPDRISNEQEKQQERLLTQNDVLGTTDPTKSGAQLIFFENNDVLGAQTNRELGSKKSFNLVTVFMQALESVDRFILTLWGNILR